jgi:hypothetical protein
MCEEWEGKFIWDDMAVAVNDEFNLAPGVPSGDATGKHCLAHGWKNTRVSWLPYLTPRHFSDRAAWAKKHSEDAFYARVDVDEKWFYAEKLHVKAKKAPGM